MEEKDYIKDLFSEKLGNHSVQVNPELWSSIASKLPAATAVSSGISLTSKVLIGLGTAASITVATIFLTDEKEVVKKVEKTEQQIIPNQQDKKEVIQKIKTDLEDSKYTVSAENVATSQKARHLDCELPHDFENDEIELIQVERSDFSENKISSKESAIANEKQVFLENGNIDKKEVIEIAEIKVKSKEERKSDLFIGDLPNIFTPNNDKENDLFAVEIKGLSDFSLTILNAENKVVFTSSDTNFKWDGKDFSENLVPTGNYFYFFTGTDSNKKAVSKSNILKVHY